MHTNVTDPCDSKEFQEEDGKQRDESRAGQYPRGDDVDQLLLPFAVVSYNLQDINNGEWLLGLPLQTDQRSSSVRYHGHVVFHMGPFPCLDTWYV